VLATVLSPVTHAEECKPLKSYGKIPFATDDGLRINLTTTLAGKPTHLVLDTGAYWSTIRRDLVEDLGLKTRKGTSLYMLDLAGEKMDKVAIVPEVKVGGLGYGAAEFFIAGAPPAPIEEEGGLLGQNLLNRIDLDIDNARKTVTLFSQDHCDGDGVYWADEAVVLEFKRSETDSMHVSRAKREERKSTNDFDVPIVWAQFEGRNVAVTFDTGATHTSMDLGLAKAVFGIDEHSPGVRPAGESYVANGGTVQDYSYTFKKLSIAGVTFENVPVLLSKFDSGKDVLLGMHEMRHLHLYIAYKEGRIYITAADAGIKPQATK
jgi:predicted aspartyl protease